MTRSQSLFFRFLLFLTGAGIVVLSFFLINVDRSLSRIDVFTWLSIALMYLVFFLPFFFSAINIANFSGKIPVLSMVWLGILFYIAASVAIILLLKNSPAFSLNTAIIIQAILLFLFFIDVYFAYFASSHVQSVAAEEAEKQRFISQIKSKAQVLSLSLNRLPAEYENAQKTLMQTVEDIKYIYPVNGSAGGNLEQLILISLNTLSELADDILSGAHSVSLESEAANLQTLVKERKLLRN